MANIFTRQTVPTVSGENVPANTAAANRGSPITNAEVDNNWISLNNAQGSIKNILTNAQFEYSNRAVPASNISNISVPIPYPIMDGWEIYVASASNAAVAITFPSDRPNPPVTGLCLQIRAAVAATAGAARIMVLEQPILGSNFAKFTGKALTLSGWVKSSKVGTYGVALQNGTRTLSCVQTINITAINTWQYVTCQFPANPASGTWDFARGVGAYFCFCLYAGLTFQTTSGSWKSGNYFTTSSQFEFNVTANLNTTIQFADFQLEVGNVATLLERRTVGRDLAVSFPTAASPRVNAIANGAFEINPLVYDDPWSAAGYCIAPWYIESVGGAPGTASISRGSWPTADQDVAGRFRLGWTQSAGALVTQPALVQKIEDVWTFSGDAVALSFCAAVLTGSVVVNVELEQYFGIAGSASVITSLGSVTVNTTSPYRFALFTALPTIDGKTLGPGATPTYLKLRFKFPLASTYTLFLGRVQLEQGLINTVYQVEPHAVAQLRANRQIQRYGASINGIVGIGIADSTSTVVFRIDATQMEDATTAVNQASLEVTNFTTSWAVTSISAYSNNKNNPGIVQVTVAAAPLTKGTSYAIRATADSGSVTLIANY